MFKKLPRPTPSMAVSLAALVIAMCGTAVAAGPAFVAAVGDSKSDKKIAKSAAKSYFKSHIGKASVAHATTAGSAGTAGSAATATNASNAALLGGLPASSLARAGHAEVFTDDGSTNLNFSSDAGFTNIMTKTVTAPANGVLLIFGDVHFEHLNSGTGTFTGLDTRLTLDGTRASTDQEAQATAGIGPGVDASLANSTAVPVSAGTHTVAIAGQTNLDAGAAGSTAFVMDRSITTLFVPFGDTGAQATGLSRTSRDPLSARSNSNRR